MSSDSDWNNIGEWSIVEMLPDEVLIAIFKYLPVDCLLVCEIVSKRWRRLVRDVDVWKNIVMVYSGKPELVIERERNLNIISTHSECISQLKLQYVSNYSESIMVLNKCNNLTSIELCKCFIEKEFENDIVKWSNLKQLSLKNSATLKRNINLNLQFDKFKSLKLLALPEFGLSRANCDTLIGLKYLCHIEIEKIQGLSVEYMTKLILSKQDILVTFNIYGGDSVDDNCMILLSKCPRLQDLSIIYCQNLRDEAILALKNLKVIEQLQISNNEHFTEESLLKALGSPSMFNLRRLSLSNIRNVTPVVIDCISEYYKNLKCLALFHCPRIVNSDYEKQLRIKLRKIDIVLY